MIVHLLFDMFPELPNGLPVGVGLAGVLPNNDVKPEDSWFWLSLAKVKTNRCCVVCHKT